MVTLTTWGRGVLLTNSRANVLDTLLPTLMGIVEFGLFAVLYPRKGLDGKDIRWANGTEPWHLWPFANALHALLAVFLVLNRIYNTDPIKDFEPRLQPLASQYMDWMRGDWKGALGTAIVITILGYFTLPLARKKSRWYLAFCFLPVVVYAGVVNMAEHQRQLTDDYVFGLAAAPTPSPSPPCQQVLDEIRRTVCR
ncbi:MAG: hypothetical protein DMF72_18030 [Acidobacteria bacterium]|nr:MAG: hypothetical protein DMF72_18030 [Acidobacteriota bacterium]